MHRVQLQRLGSLFEPKTRTNRQGRHFFDLAKDLMPIMPPKCFHLLTHDRNVEPGLSNRHVADTRPSLPLANDKTFICKPLQRTIDRRAGTPIFFSQGRFARDKFPERPLPLLYPLKDGLANGLVRHLGHNLPLSRILSSEYAACIS